MIQTICSGYSFNAIIPVHTHPVSSTAVVSSDNEPLFYKLALWYMDYAEWYKNIKSFPPQSVFLTKGSLNWDEVQLFDAPVGRYIRLGNVGLTGGSNTHLHGLTGQLDNMALKAEKAGKGSDLPRLAININFHKHSFEGNTNLATSEPVHVTCPLYIAKSGTTRAMAGVICFTDDPEVCPDKWSFATDLFDNFVLAGNSFSPSTGFNSHVHNPSEIHSSQVTSSIASSLQKIGYPIKFQNVPTSHDHLVDTSVPEAIHVPPCVTLIPMLLTQTISKIQTYDKSALLSFGAKKGVSLNYIMFLPKKKAVSSLLPISSNVNKNNINKFLDINLSTKQSRFLGCDYDFLYARENYLGYSLDALLIFTSHEFAVSMRLLNSWLPQGELVLDAIMKGWIDQIQKVDNKIQVMYLNSSLDFAIGTDLDTKWGEIYNVPRFSNESDDVYRQRIKTYTTMQTGSGTKKTIESILDTVTGETGSSRVETHFPGQVKVFFDTSTALHTAYDHQPLVEYLIQQALAVGIYYDIYYSFYDFPVTVNFKGPLESSWLMDFITHLLNQSAFIDTTFRMLLAISTISNDMSMVTSKKFNYPFKVYASTMHVAENYLSILNRMKIRLLEEYPLTCRISKNAIKIKSWFDVLQLKTREVTMFNTRAAIQKTKNMPLFVTVTLK